MFCFVRSIELGIPPGLFLFHKSLNINVKEYSKIPLKIIFCRYLANWIICLSLCKQTNKAMNTFIYPEAAFEQARIDAERIGDFIEVKSCISYAGEVCCIDAYTWTGERVVRHIICDLEYMDATYQERGI